ncbi:MAG TPA: TIGR03086 family metal-binding protein [Mycobacterium sp.]|nr:TIGR03086 family metal-binding protein [Mycobacterium sp.]
MSSDLRPGPESPPTDELDSAEATLGILQQVLHTIARDDLSRQTPCTEYDVAQLTDHLLNSITVIGGAVDAELPPRDDTDSVERQIIAAARPALDAWHRHGLNGMVMVGPNEAPAAVMAGVLSIEFLVHAWDYAMATGRDVDVPDSLAEYVLGLAKKIITPQGRTNVGFDPPVEVPADVGALDRLIAFTGRKPAG